MSKNKIVIDGIPYEVPEIVFKKFRETAKDVEKLEIAVENLERYIKNHTGAITKA